MSYGAKPAKKSPAKKTPWMATFSHNFRRFSQRFAKQTPLEKKDFLTGKNKRRFNKIIFIIPATVKKITLRLTSIPWQRWSPLRFFPAKKSGSRSFVETAVSPFLKKARGCFQKKPLRKVGLDIGSYNLKVVELEKKDGSIEIVSAGIKEIRETQDLSLAVKELFKETGISVKEVNISLSGDNAVVARYLSLPRMNEDELNKALAFELADRIPFKANEVYTDYSILEDTADSKNRMSVFLVAAKKDILDTRVEFVQKAGLLPRVITMDTLALKNTFYFNYPAKETASIAILSIGNKISNLLITRKQIPYFVRDIRFGGEAITTLIQSKLGLSQKDAEALKHNIKDAPGDIFQTIKTTLTPLLNEIRASLDFYENLTEHKIDEVYICGGSAMIISSKDFLEDYLNLKIFNLEPLKNFSVSANISQETRTNLAPFLAIAIGLALEEP